MVELSETTTTMAGIFLLSLVTVESGGALLLKIARGTQPATDIQRTFFRAGHAHAGVFLTLALATQVFVDAADLSGVPAVLARSGVGAAAILMPAGFFLSVVKPGSTKPSRVAVLIPIGATVLAAGLVCLGIGLLVA